MIIWQTGEPPTGVELLIEYEWDSRQFHAVATFNGRNWVDAPSGEDLARIKLLRWSTLDAAPDVIGRLEAWVRERCEHLSVSIDFSGVDWTVYDENGNELVEATTLAGAIEQLCGGTDGP